MRISDWSSDVCSSDLLRMEGCERPGSGRRQAQQVGARGGEHGRGLASGGARHLPPAVAQDRSRRGSQAEPAPRGRPGPATQGDRTRVVEGRNVSVRVDTGGGRFIKNKKEKQSKN